MCQCANVPMCQCANGFKTKEPRYRIIESSNHRINLDIVRGRRCTATSSRPVGMEELPAWGIHTFILVCTKVVPLCLQQVGRQSFAPEAIEIGKCRSKRGHRDAVHQSSGTDPTPALLSGEYRFFEERRQQ